jgi:hypothetical protein
MVMGGIEVCNMLGWEAETGTGIRTWMGEQGTEIAYMKTRYQDNKRKSKYKGKYTRSCVRKVKERKEIL